MSRYFVWIFICSLLWLPTCTCDRSWQLQPQESCNPANTQGLTQTTRWKQTFGSNAKSAYACLQIVWDDQKQSTSQFVELDADGTIYGLQSGTDLTRVPLALTLPPDAKASTLQFYVFVLAPEQATTQSAALCRSIGNAPTYVQRCLTDDEKAYCWFYLSFSPSPVGSEQNVNTQTQACQLFSRPFSQEPRLEAQKETPPEDAGPEQNLKQDANEPPSPDMLSPEESVDNEPTVEQPPEPLKDAPQCNVGDTRACYTAAPDSQDIGLCKAGKETCQADRTWGPCQGEVTPAPKEQCDGKDEDCDGVLDNTGALPLYTTQPTELNDISIVDITTDPSGNIYVLGHFKGKLQFGSITRTSQALATPGQYAQNIFVLALDKTGTVQGLSTTGGKGTHHARSILHHTKEKVLYVAIDYVKELTLEQNGFPALVPSSPVSRWLVMTIDPTKIAPAGQNGLFETVTYTKFPTSAGGESFIQSITQLEDGVVIVGEAKGPFDWYQTTFQDTNKYVVIARLKNTTSTSQNWALRLYSTTARTSVGDVKVDTNNIYITGTFDGGLLYFEPNPNNLTISTGSTDGYLAVISRAGSPSVLIKSVEGVGGGSSAPKLALRSLELHPPDHVLIAGEFNGEIRMNSKNINTQGKNQGLLLSLRKSTNTYVYHKHYITQSTTGAKFTSIVRDRKKQFYALGKFRDQLKIATGVWTYPGYTDNAFFMRFDPSTLQTTWAKPIQSTGLSLNSFTVQTDALTFMGSLPPSLSTNTNSVDFLFPQSKSPTNIGKHMTFLMRLHTSGRWQGCFNP